MTLCRKGSSNAKFSETLRGRRQPKRGELTPAEERNKIVGFIAMYSETPFSVEMELSSAGLSVKQPNVTLSVEWLAKLCGIERTSYYRWKKNSVDRRKGANHSNNAVYTEAMDERALKYIKTHPDLNVDELIATCLDQCDEQDRSIGWYLGSRSRVYRLMRKA